MSLPELLPSAVTVIGLGALAAAGKGAQARPHSRCPLGASLRAAARALSV